jgi:tetratricopeptide (TPR) repeat protein
MSKHKQHGKSRAIARAASPKSRSQESSWGWNKEFWIPALILLAITAAVFIPSLSGSFVNWDDPENLLKNENLRAFRYEWSWPAVKAIFTTDVIGNYNPLSIFSFAIEKYLFAPDPKVAPFVFHFSNLWMHLACTLLVFVLFLQLRLGRMAAFIGALLFGIHPMRVESVAWITERKDVLYGMFFLASLVTYSKFVQSETSRMRWYMWTLVLSVFSYFAKVQAVILPLSMVALDFFYQRKWKSPKILMLEKAPWWVLSLLIGLVNLHFLKAGEHLILEDNIANYTALDRLAVGAYSYAIYLAKWIYPYRMSPLYPYPLKLPAGAYVALALVPAFLAAFLYWAIRTRRRNLLFGWAFFTVNVMFLLQVVGAGQGFLADRFTYIAYAGLFFLMAWGCHWIMANRPAMKTHLYISGGIYLAIFAYMTWDQCKIWNNGGALWEHARKYYANNPLPWAKAANYYREEEKNFAKAAEFFSQALKLERKKAPAYNSLGKTYFDQVSYLNQQDPNFQQEKTRLTELAIRNYTSGTVEDSLAGGPNPKITSEIFINRGAAYASLGMFDPALRDLTRGIQLDPENEDGYLNRALLYVQTSQFEKAILDHNEYLKINPYDPDIWYERGLCHSILKQTAEAIRDFDSAISLKQTQPLYFAERAKAKFATGDKSGARSDALRAQQMGLNVPPELLR